MTVNNLSTNLNSSANSGSQHMGTPALAKAGSSSKSLSTVPNTSKGVSGVEISISSKAKAAYEASLRSASEPGLTPDQLKNFTDRQLAVTPLAQFNKLGAAQLALIPPAAIKGLTLEQIGALSTDQIAGLTALQIAALDNRQVSRITSANIKLLTNTQLASITPRAFSGMTLGQLAAITPMQGIALKATKLVYLNEDQKSAIQSKMVMAGPSQNLMQILASQNQI